ncbi:MAG: hypothetical protein LV480_12505 [Methylacidiphilales bacterium]|nr:hypothetical protein [Candidatus Methylacidiphilales bacterium]
MTVPNRLNLIAMGLAVIGGGGWVCAEDDVTVISPPAATTAPAEKTADSDGTPVVHKSLHKKKVATTAKSPSGTVATQKAQTHSAAATNTTSVVSAPVTSPVHPAAAVPTNTVATVPTVETGLPVARYPGMGTPIKGVSTYIPPTETLPPSKSGGTSAHPSYFANVMPTRMTSSSAGSYPSQGRTTSASSDFVFTNFTRRVKNVYPWKTGIITTMFWIGEGSTPLSSTTNVESSWDEDWLPNNHGSDSPYNRNGYASGSHASTLNPFYVALPFNDLAFPDKAREWLPRGWYRPPKDGRQVSACKDRWVWIKNAQGRSCFAQWEDVGPLRYDHAEYVFGDERPIGLGDDHAGLDVSPAVAQYLNIDGKNRITSWRFVDAEDVPPGDWLRLDEQAVIFTALHQMKNNGSTTSDLPIQRATEPIDDPSNIDSNKKKVDASKG